MANLLGIDWAAIDKTLKGLSQNGVERFLHIKVENTVRERKHNTVFESL